MYPWRTTSDPYHLLVAEMLLRRTRAKQVKDVYEKFIQAFPSLKTLYQAETDKIQSLVYTLGLAYRSRWIKEISRSLYENYGSTIPCDDRNLETGIGKERQYILNALRCFAFGQNTAIFDVNVKRILQRVFSIDFGHEAHKNQSAWDIASLLVPEGFSKEYNWAILDLGRMVCTARNPKCRFCPLNDICDFAKMHYA